MTTGAEPEAATRSELAEPMPRLREPPEVAEQPKERGKRVVRFGDMRLTSPDRVLYPSDGTTKLDLAIYYSRVAEWMLPHVAGRPISMVRCPEGVAPIQGEVHEDEGGGCFFHKHAERIKEPFEHVVIEELKGPAEYLAPTGADSLTELVQFGVLEVHIWGCRTSDIEHPDYLLFDLDPGEDTPFEAVVDGAKLARQLLEGLGLRSFPKTTGGKGLHVCVPLRPSQDWEGIRSFAEAVSRGMASYEPDKYVAEMSKAKRRGKVFVDYLRNSRANTSIAPYSTRARTYPTVSVPLRWAEVTAERRSDSYTVHNLPARLARLTSDPWAGFFEVDQTITPRMRREIGLAE